MNARGDIPPEELREHLHRVADWIADYRADIDARPIAPTTRPGAIAAALPATLEADGVPLATLLDEFARLIVPNVVHWGHPAFLGYFGSTTTSAGIIAEALTAALNVSAMMWSVSPAATELEQVVLGWLRDLLGLPAHFGGVVYDTASSGTLHALAAAREDAGGDVRRDGLSRGTRSAVYVSEQAHSSVDKAAIVLGLGERAVRRIPCDAELRMDPRALHAAVAADRRAGVVPCAVVATVGTTASAAVDPLPAVADVCREHRIWLHVDAAYGGALAVLPEGRWVLAGAEHADSLVVNPHKWLFVPLDFSALYSPRLDVFREVFTLTPPYLRGDAGKAGIDAMDVTLQLGRRFRALKAWMVWRWLGRDGLVARLREHRRLAGLFADWVDAEPGWVRCAPVHMGVVCFRAFADAEPEAADRANERVAAAVVARGDAYLTHTRLGGRTVLRIGLGNVLTEERHLRRAWNVVRAAAALERL